MHTERQRGYHSYEVGRSEVRMPGKASVFFFFSEFFHTGAGP